MARYLVLDWDHQYLQILAADVKHGAVRLQRAAAWPETFSPNPAQAEELGLHLRERLQQAGLAPAPVIVVVGRERVILKDIRHPVVAAGEEPALVRFQAVKELHDAPEDVVLDYVPGETEGGERRALAVVLRRELLATYQELCKAAGLKLAGICPRPFGSAAAARAAGAQDTVAVLTATERWAEFCVVRGDTLLLARTIAPGTNDAGLLGEIRRNLAVFSGQSARAPVSALYVADGTEVGLLRERLLDKLAIPVHALDPLAGLPEPAARRGAFAGAAGLLHTLASAGALPINFAKPRDARPAGDPNKRKLVLAGGLVAALLLVGIAFAWTELAARDRTMDELVRQRSDLDRQLTLLKDDEKRLKVVGDWVNSEVVWLDELYDLTERFPEPKNLRLTQVATQPLTKAGSDKHIAQLTLRGLTTESFEALDHFIAQLGADRHYRVGAKEISPNTAVDRKTFGQQFEAKVDVAPRPAHLYTRRLPAPPPKKLGKPAAEAFDPAALLEGGQP